jgi:hypothetical protein
MSSILRMTVVVLAWGAFASLPFAAGGDQSEDAVKAAFLINFAKYTEWPKSVSRGDLVIGVIGRSGVADSLESLAKDRSINGRPVRFKRCEWTTAHQTNLLFVAKSEKESYDRLSSLLKSSVVTVGETAGFAQSHGMIGFKIENDRVAFEINPTRAKTAGITFSSRLLQLAKVVGR